MSQQMVEGRLPSPGVSLALETYSHSLSSVLLQMAASWDFLFIFYFLSSFPLMNFVSFFFFFFLIVLTVQQQHYTKAWLSLELPRGLSRPLAISLPPSVKCLSRGNLPACPGSHVQYMWKFFSSFLTLMSASLESLFSQQELSTGDLNDAGHHQNHRRKAALKLGTAGQPQMPQQLVFSFRKQTAAHAAASLTVKGDVTCTVITVSGHRPDQCLPHLPEPEPDTIEGVN